MVQALSVRASGQGHIASHHKDMKERNEKKVQPAGARAGLCERRSRAEWPFSRLPCTSRCPVWSPWTPAQPEQSITQSGTRCWRCGCVQLYGHVQTSCQRRGCLRRCQASPSPVQLRQIAGLEHAQSSCWGILLRDTAVPSAMAAIASIRPAGQCLCLHNSAPGNDWKTSKAPAGKQSTHWKQATGRSCSPKTLTNAHT